MKKMFWLFLFLFWGSSLQAENSFHSFFYEGNRLYSEGKYKEAIEQYNRILQEKKESEALYYNLGNSYYKIGEKGKALVAYKRALKQSPRDQELRYNLRLVQSQLQDQITPQPKNRLTQSYWNLVDSLSLFEWEVLFFAFYSLVFILLGIYLLFSSKRKVSFRFLTLAASFALVVAVCFAGKSVKSAQRLAIVLAQEVQARYGPSENDAAAFVLHEGGECRVLSTQNQWVQIRLADGKMAWLPRQAVEII